MYRLRFELEYRAVFHALTATIFVLAQDVQSAELVIKGEAKSFGELVGLNPPKETVVRNQHASVSPTLNASKSAKKKVIAEFSLDQVLGADLDLLSGNMRVSPVQKEKSKHFEDAAFSNPLLDKAANTQESPFRIIATEAGLTSIPKTLRAKLDQGPLQVAISGSEHGVNIFVRDPERFAWNPQTQHLIPSKPGHTELYVVSRGKMLIVPITIEAEEGKRHGSRVSKGDTLVNLTVPKELVALDAKSLGRAPPAASSPLDTLPDFTSPVNFASQTLPVSINKKESASTDASGSPSQEPATLPFQRYTTSRGLHTVRLQIVDDRSNLQAGTVFPVAGVRVKIVGTDFIATSDMGGNVVLSDVPSWSRFQIAVDDPEGRIVASASEFVTGSGQVDDAVTRIKVLRSVSFDYYSRISGVVQDSRLASVCGLIVNQSDGQTFQGVSVAIDGSASGPFYINNYGYLDPSLAATSASGRFCFLNADPGVAMLTLTHQNGKKQSLPLGLFSGLHVEHEYRPEDEAKVSVALGVVPPIHEQRSSGYVDHLAAADSAPMNGFAGMEFSLAVPGKMESVDPLPLHQGRTFAHVEASEFESTVYAIDNPAPVAPLIPRGFLEDLALMAGMTFSAVWVESNWLKC